MLRHFRPHLRPVRGLLAVGLAASVNSAVMQWIAPWPLKYIFDSVINHKPLPSYLSGLPVATTSLLWVLAGVMSAVAILLALSDYLSTRCVATAGQRVIFAIRGQLFRHIEAQGTSFHQRRQVGDLLARLGGDVQAIQNAVVTAVPTLVRNVLTLLGMVVIMLVVQWRFSLLAILLVPVLAVASRHYLTRIKAIQRRARHADGEASAVAQETLTSMTVVQAFGAEDVEARRYEEATGRGLEEGRRAIVAQSQFTPLVTLVMTMSTVAVLLFGVQAINSGQLSAGDLLVFMAYLRGMFSPIRQLSKLAGVLGRAHAAADRVIEILNTHDEVAQVSGATRIRRAAGTLAWHDVSFAYRDGVKVLDGVTLEVPVGTRLALVGLTGSGKSTAMRMVPRFLEPTSGAVLLDGVDVARLDLADLRRQIAYVPQEPYLFRATVWENILYGRADADKRAAIDVARRVGLHEVIESFPHGYDTMIGERGLALSGGQRQCVAITRAMARQAPVLLLDEPTVGLDAELESEVLSALEIAAAGSTTIIVSHQLSGLRWVDQIAVLSDGRILELGSHAELEAHRSVYWKLSGLRSVHVDEFDVDETISL
ncbi:MAG: ABC transporter ATP-binding protein [Acidobacteriota bacterium]|nr:ABC transporter ATP-binding protein/permease [Acidobacteriota bacterium]MDE3138263.1 ABC transporter ATP-binding protein [Acidobacteriota bacterium]